jgi:hypothetical protein
MTEHDQPPEWAVSVLSGLAALERELRLLRQGFERHCGEERAAHQAQTADRARSLDELTRMLGALAEGTAALAAARLGPRRPAPVVPIRPDGDR